MGSSFGVIAPSFLGNRQRSVKRDGPIKKQVSDAAQDINIVMLEKYLSH